MQRAGLAILLCVAAAACQDGNGPGEPCGGYTRDPPMCRSGLACLKRPGTCHTADLPGICEEVPTACTKEFAPVCGCDGKTYGNDCQRRAASMGLDHTGPCAPDAGP